MRSIPVDDPLPEHIHPDASDKNGDEQQPAGIVIVYLVWIKQKPVQQEENGSVEGAFGPFVTQHQSHLKSNNLPDLSKSFHESEPVGLNPCRFCFLFEAFGVEIL